MSNDAMHINALAPLRLAICRTTLRIRCAALGIHELRHTKKSEG